MIGKLLNISLEGINAIRSEEYSRRNLGYRTVEDISNIEDSIRKYAPDAVLLQVNEISDIIVYKLREAFRRTEVHIPWLCLVMDNSALGERIARTNRVFYYGVGYDDIGFVMDALKDAIMIGKQYKLENKIIKDIFAFGREA